jgi:hypothetical protein
LRTVVTVVVALEDPATAVKVFSLDFAKAAWAPVVLSEIVNGETPFDPVTVMLVDETPAAAGVEVIRSEHAPPFAASEVVSVQSPAAKAA